MKRKMMMVKREEKKQKFKFTEVVRAIVMEMEGRKYCMFQVEGDCCGSINTGGSNKISTISIQW